MILKSANLRDDGFKTLTKSFVGFGQRFVRRGRWDGEVGIHGRRKRREVHFNRYKPTVRQRCVSHFPILPIELPRSLTSGELDFDIFHFWY